MSEGLYVLADCATGAATADAANKLMAIPWKNMMLDVQKYWVYSGIVDVEAGSLLLSTK